LFSFRGIKAKFKYSNFFTTCESYLQGLRSCTKELIEQKVEDKSSIENVFDHLQKYWENLILKIESMNSKLTTLPNAKETFDKNIHNLTAWLNELEQNKRNLNNNDLSSTEYKRILDKINVIIHFFCFFFYELFSFE
jgi:DNA repair ATPase RecN